MPMSEGAWRNWRSRNLIHSEKLTAASLIHKVFPFKIYACCWSWPLCPQPATQGLPVNLEIPDPGSPVPQGTGRLCAEIELRMLRESFSWASFLDRVNLHILTCGILTPIPRLSSNRSRWPSEFRPGTVPAPVLSLPTLWEHRAGLTKLPHVRSFPLPSQGLTVPLAVTDLISTQYLILLQDCCYISEEWAGFCTSWQYFRNKDSLELSISSNWGKIQHLIVTH